MAELQLDPFVSTEPEVELDDATRQVICDRLKKADEGRLIPSSEARERILTWLSKSSTSKTR